MIYSSAERLNNGARVFLKLLEVSLFLPRDCVNPGGGASHSGGGGGWRSQQIEKPDVVTACQSKAGLFQSKY